MKKRIILIIVIALACVALACGLLIMNIKAPNTTEKNTTTTKAPDEEYSMDDSLTQRDIEFLEKINAIDQIPSKNTSDSQWSIGSIMAHHDAYDGEEGKLFLIENDMENEYYLCLYDTVWYRFDDCDCEDLPFKIEGKELKQVYMLCDSIIKYDMITGIEYDIEFTFYFDLGTDKNLAEKRHDSYSSFCNIISYRPYTINDKHLDGSEYLFLAFFLWDLSPESNDFWLYTDDNGITYMHFWANYGFYYDGVEVEEDWQLKARLVDCYYEFLPYFERLEELEPESERYQAIGIRIEILKELLFRGETSK